MREPVILIADNDQQYLNSLAELFRSADCHPILASSVRAANKLLQDEVIDLALVDLRLTCDGWEDDFTGLDVADQALEENVPCVVITAYESVEAMRRALHRVGRQPPAVDFVVKKEDPSELMRRARAVLALEPFPILHISDLHFGKPGDTVDSAQDRSLFAMRRDLKRLRERRQVGRIKALVVSGDIVYRGNTRGYKPALDFLRRLCGELRLRPEDVVLVPGNHDVDRNAAEPLKLRAFLDFSTEFYGVSFYEPGKLHRVFDFGRVAIVALDSCHLEGNSAFVRQVDNSEYFPGWIDLDQLRKAIEVLPSGRDILRLAVCHHHVLSESTVENASGVSYLCNYHETVKPWLAQSDVQILLHGHGHRARLLRPEMAGSRMPMAFGSGTLLLARDPTGSDRNQYLVLNLGPKSQVIMRRYLRLEQDGSYEWGVDQTVSGEGIVDLPEITLTGKADYGL